MSQNKEFETFGQLNSLSRMKSLSVARIDDLVFSSFSDVESMDAGENEMEEEYLQELNHLNELDAVIDKPVQYKSQIFIDQVNKANMKSAVTTVNDSTLEVSSTVGHEDKVEFDKEAVEEKNAHATKAENNKN